MEIHISRDGQQYGPYAPAEVQRQLAAGTLFLTDLAWTDGMATWTPLSAWPQFTSGSTAAASGAPGPVPVFVQSIPPQMPAPQTAGLAIASLILGILGIIIPIIASLGAIICGHIARSEIRRSNGRLEGAGMALAGLIMGYLLFAVVPLAIVAGIALPVFAEVQLRGSETKSLSNAKQIATACKLYAVDNSGAYPSKLDQLVPDYLPDRSLFASPLSPGESMAYYYYGGKDTDPAENVLLMSKFKDRRGKRIIIHSDTSGIVALPPANLLPPPGQ
jgi:hypothetical protein